MMSNNSSPSLAELEEHIAALVTNNNGNISVSSGTLSLNGGLNNHWATNNTPWSWGHFKRSDIPVQYAIADGWTVGDMYQVRQ